MFMTSQKSQQMSLMPERARDVNKASQIATTTTKKRLQKQQLQQKKSFLRLAAKLLGETRS